MIIEGSIAVKAAINYHKRDISRVIIAAKKKTKDFNYIRKITKLNNIELVEASDQDILKLANGKTHGGVLALASERRYDEFVEGDIFYLDGIEDPFNLGYALRTLYAFGIKNVLLSNRDYSMMEPQLLKSSAGCYDGLNIKICNDEINEISKYKDDGYHLYGLFRGQDAKDIFECQFEKKALFILGGEKRGISSEILKICDDYLFISYGSDFRNSLNACAALDVVATLLYKQRKIQ